MDKVEVLQAVSERDVAELSPLATRSKATIGAATSTPRTRKRKADSQDIEAAAEAVIPVTDAQSDYDVGEEGVEDPNARDDEERTAASISRPSKTPLHRKEKHGGDHSDIGPAGLLPGLGTMFEPAVDWLSDERWAEYARWKKSILREVAVVEQKA